MTILTNCQTSKKSAGKSVADQPTLVISMKKTACYGSCPVYEIQIYSDLSVKLTGEQYLDQIGSYKGQIEKSRLEGIKDQFHSSGYFDMEEKYWEAISDLPTTYLYFDDGNRSKKVMDYYGAPAALKEIEDTVAQLLEELIWVKIEE